MADKGFNAKERFSCFGRTTLKKLNKFHIYIEGLSKVGAELTANLLMLNPQSITLHDPQKIALEDCYNTFLYPRELVGKVTRADCLIDTCKKISKKVTVTKVNEQITQEDAHKYDLLIFCDIYDVDRVIKIDSSLRENRIQTGVIFTGQLGFYGYLYTDFGQEFKMLNTGKQLPVLLIENITSDAEGKVTLNKQFKHDFQHGDFIRIDNVEGMKEVNGDARPVKIIDDYSFQIQNTSNYGKYQSKGVAKKVKITTRIPFQDIKTQVLYNDIQDSETGNLALATSAVLSFYFTNKGKLPQFYTQSDQNQAFQTAQNINKGRIEINQKLLRDIFKTCSYSFYPLTYLIASVVATECVKKTGKLEPILTPYFINWYDRINFENKKRIEGQHFNILAHDTFQKLLKLQMGVVDEGALTLELFCLLYSCQIAENRKVLLFGVETLEQKQVGDPYSIKAHIKYQIASDLFKSRKMESLPCSLSFSNDSLISQAWKRIKLLVNGQRRVNEYIYDNAIFNQIDLIDCQMADMNAMLRMCVCNQTRLIDQLDIHASEVIIPNEFRFSVEWAVDLFQLIFITVYEDIKCFAARGSNYTDHVKMEPSRKRIFYALTTHLESGGYLSKENTVKIAKTIFNCFFQEEIKGLIKEKPENHWSGYEKKPLIIELEFADSLIEEFLIWTYSMLSWFFCKEKIQSKHVLKILTEHLYKEELQLNDREKESIALSKIEMLSSISNPYGSLNELYKNQETVQFIWNASRLRAKIFGIQEEITSKKFYKFYNKTTRPCPFITQQLISHVPLAIIELTNKKYRNVDINGLEHKIEISDCQKPLVKKTVENEKLIPNKATEWTIITIQGPKTLQNLIEYFRVEEGVEVTKIKCESSIIYNPNTKDLSKTIEQASGIKSSVIQLVVQAVDREKKPCLVCRTKYICK